MCFSKKKNLVEKSEFYFDSFMDVFLLYVFLQSKISVGILSAMDVNFSPFSLCFFLHVRNHSTIVDKKC